MIMIQKKDLRVREKTRAEESSKKEEDAYEENRRQGELLRPPAPISFYRFGFHLDSAELFLLRKSNAEEVWFSALLSMAFSPTKIQMTYCADCVKMKRIPKFSLLKRL